MNNQENIKIFSKWSRLYDIFFGSNIFNKQRKKAIDLLELQSRDNVLLIGIGTGEDLKFIPKGVKVTGIDITDDMLDIAQKKAIKLGIKDIEIIKMDGQNLEFSEDTFDAIVLNMILAVIPDGNKCLKESERVLKANGKIVVFDKFLQENRESNIFRSLINKITIKLGTDINRKFLEIKEGTNLKVIKDLKSIFGGMYRIILLKKI
jgi:ubiquinone/menaquinone biosynthesis C-methylase UbiE